mgnify:CR=1 FL=1
MVRLRIFGRDKDLTERLSMAATDFGNRVSRAKNRISDYAYRISDVIVHKTKVPFTIGVMTLNLTGYSLISYHAINGSLDRIGMSNESLKKAGITYVAAATVCSLPLCVYGALRLRDRYRRDSGTEHYENRA